MLSILIAEDSDVDYLRAYRFLEPLGHEIIRATDGEKAIEYLNDMVYDLVLLDVDMPKADGYSVLSEIKSSNIHRGTPVAMLTSRSSHSDMSISRRLGAFVHLVKPVTREQLLKMMSDVENRI